MRGSVMLVWLFLSDRADEHSEVAVSIREIAYGTGLDQMAVSRAIRSLVEQGTIIRVSRDGHRSPWRYRLVQRREMWRREA